LLFVLLTACPSEDYKNIVVFANDSEYNITVYIGVVPYSMGGSLYPDTLLPKVKCGINYDAKQEKGYSYNFEYQNNDTLCFFIWNTDMVSKYEWDDFRDSYNILCRYDLSKQDIETLQFRISYPPTERMKNVKMYPPYGELMGH